MSEIAINDLATVSPSAIDGDYYGLVFTNDGDTNKVVFQDAVEQSFENAGNVIIKEASLTIASADVLTLNTTPLTVVPSVTGYIIDPIDANVDIDFNTTPYDTNVGLQLFHDGAGSIEPIMITNSALNASVSSRRKFTVDSSFAAADTQLLANEDLKISAPGGDPATGDSDITINVLYRLKQV
jgi:hypothetical protein